ncbi:hypothetical protein BB558_004902 [Smittium angustum]|uniref:Phospholipid scramblase n=1 Tax=Smittium angustum TaxID=133377 RepID=A0A2U1J1Z8_SMIAN|nr:hypothetical protein BB558_004902 [Smittium angustum]
MSSKFSTADTGLNAPGYTLFNDKFNGTLTSGARVDVNSYDKRLNGAVITNTHPAAFLLSHGFLAISKTAELSNIVFGIDKANKYVILNGQGSAVGYINETSGSFDRFFFGKSRPLDITVKDIQNVPLFKIKRELTMFTSDIIVSDVKGKQIGSSNEKVSFGGRYTLKTPGRKFAYSESAVISRHFSVFSPTNKLVAKITRKFIGFVAEAFTDSGNYNIIMDPELLRLNGLKNNSLKTNTDVKSYEQLEYI